jgi:hypothetical protein
VSQEDEFTTYSQGISQSLGWDSDRTPPGEIWPLLSFYARNQRHNCARWRFRADRHILRSYVLGTMAESNGQRDLAERIHEAGQRNLAERLEEMEQHGTPWHNSPVRQRDEIVPTGLPSTPANGLNFEEGGRLRGYNGLEPLNQRQNFAAMPRRRPRIRPRRERSPLSDGSPDEEDPEQLVPNLQVSAGAEGGNARNPLENPSGERTEPLRQNLEVPRNPEILINQLIN